MCNMTWYKGQGTEYSQGTGPWQRENNGHLSTLRLPVTLTLLGLVMARSR